MVEGWGRKATFKFWKVPKFQQKSAFIDLKTIPRHALSKFPTNKNKRNIKKKSFNKFHYSPWYPHDISMISPWYPHDIPMISPWYPHDNKFQVNSPISLRLALKARAMGGWSVCALSALRSAKRKRCRPSHLNRTYCSYRVYCIYIYIYILEMVTYLFL